MREAVHRRKVSSSWMVKVVAIDLWGFADDGWTEKNLNPKTQWRDRNEAIGNKSHGGMSVTIVMLRQVVPLVSAVPSKRLTNKLSSVRPRWRAFSVRFLPVPVSSGRDRHRPPGTLPGQVKARSLQNPRG